MKTLFIGAIFLAAVAGQVAPARAYEQVKKEFLKKYVKGAPATDAEKSLKEAAEKAGCAVCHIPKMDKKNRNSYGKAIKKFIPDVLGKKDPDKADIDALKNNAQQIDQLLEKAAKEPSDPDKPGSPTFGDLIKEGKLPGK